jgi:predicted membrane protein
MMPEQSVRPRPVLTSQLILGLAVISVGVLFTLDNLDVLDASRYLPFWPVVLVAVGLLNLTTGREGPQRVLGVFLTFVGGWLLLGRWGLVNVRFWDLWPLLLVFWGAMIVWRGWHGRSSEHSYHDSSSVFSIVAFLSGFDRVITCESFQGGDISAFMGGGKLDLTRARLAPGTTAVVNVSALMGGMEIRIPEEWAVDNKVVYFMGGSNDRSRFPNQSNAPRLVLRGFVMMGGVEIKNPRN